MFHHKGSWGRGGLDNPITKGGGKGGEMTKSLLEITKKGKGDKSLCPLQKKIGLSK